MQHLALNCHPYNDNQADFKILNSFYSFYNIHILAINNLSEINYDQKKKVAMIFHQKFLSERKFTPFFIPSKGIHEFECCNDS